MHLKFSSLIRNLTFWVLLAILAGVLVGHFNPKLGVQSKVLGTYFIEVVKVFIYPIIFLTISLGISSMNSLKKVGRIGGKALIYFEVVTTLALIIGIITAHIIKPGSGITPDTGTLISEVNGYAAKSSDYSWKSFLLENKTFQVLLFSIFFGLVLSKLEIKDKIIKALERISKIIFKALHFVMVLAPIGAFGGMAFTIGKYGLASLLPLAKLMVTVYSTMAIFVFVVLYFILRMYNISILKYINYMKEELLIVLGTSSSEAALPNLMEKLERMGCPKPIVGLVVPAGYSFNLDGTTIYLSMAVIFLAQAFNVELTYSQMLTIIGVLMVTSKGAAGVTGSGFVVLASTLSVVKVIPLEGLALLLGVDRFMSEARAITNFIGNGVATIWISNNENDFDRAKMEYAFANVQESEDILKDNLGIEV